MDLNSKMFLYASHFNGEHRELYYNKIKNKNAAEWMDENVPLFECDDETIEETYYFRFWTFRKHIKDAASGTVISSYMPDGAGPEDNVITPAIAHHVNEGRWLADRSIIENDIRYLLGGENRDRLVNCASGFIAAVCDYILFTGNFDFFREISGSLCALYDAIEAKYMTEYGLYRSDDATDGMPGSISGSGLRPTLNTYMFSGASGLCVLLKKIGSAEYKKYEIKARELRKNIRNLLWDKNDGFYKTIPMTAPNSVPDFDRATPEAQVREEIGFIPLCNGELVSKRDDEAWKCLKDENVFSAPCGITTADMSHPFFEKKPMSRECPWDGPIMPFATSQTLTSLYRYLSARDSDSVADVDFMLQLHKYAKFQHRSEYDLRINWIDENLDPFTGQWISRDLTYLSRDRSAAADKGADCNLSTFGDLVLSGACGIRPVTDTETGKRSITVKPLCTKKWRYFAVMNLHLDGSVFEVYFDRAQNRYGFDSRLTLLRDGKVVASGTDSLVYEL